MLLKKTWFVILGSVLIGVLLVFTTNSLADHMNSIYGQAGTAGSFYDESWQATELYQTYKDVSGDISMRKLVMTGSAPIAVGTSTSSQTAVTFSPALASTGNTSPKVSITLASGGNAERNVPSHTVVTRWAVSGHVHFSSP